MERERPRGRLRTPRQSAARGEDRGELHPASAPNLVYFNEVDKGGHFAAWEEPELFASEIRAAFSSLR
ncbi:MAG: hypothetical protein JO363_03205 [Solirubrobacterales bacterium]|nr:hypothetical protein [Solirubrobacterales bacterium]